MTGSTIAQQRLCHQAIAPVNLMTPGAVMKKLGAVQAQDYLWALWALGLRMKTAVEADIERAIAHKEIVRTWPMRGTLHFVAPEDIRWLLALLTPRIIARAARRHQQLELDEVTFARSETLFTNALQNGRCLTRNAMMDVLEQASISTKGQRGYHILWWAAQNGLICFGPRQGKQHTFVLLDEWVPDGKSFSREEALAELAHRYYTGHGPATIQDFIWWSGLTAADARAGLKMAESQLAHEVFDGQTYWFSPASAIPQAAVPTAYLLPGFDEYLLGYKDRSAVLDPAHASKIVPGGNGVFKPFIVINGRVVGTWQRVLKKDRVVITLHPFDGLGAAETEAVAVAAQGYGTFINLSVTNA